MQEKHAPKNFRHFISIKSQYPLNMQNLKRILYLFFNHPSKIPYRFLSIGYYRVCAVQLSTCIFHKVDNQQYYVLYITSISEVFRFCYSSVFSVFCFFYAYYKGTFNAKPAHGKGNFFCQGCIINTYHHIFCSGRIGKRS